MYTSLEIHGKKAGYKQNKFVFYHVMFGATYIMEV